MAMEQICGTPFWNSSVSWDVSKPHFSQCFQNLALVLGSCAVLWIVTPFELPRICRTHKTPTPWTRLAICKMALKWILLIITSIDVSKAVYIYVNNPKSGLDGIIASISYLITIIMTIIITLMCKRRGLRVSLALPSFWMTSTLATLISLYSDVLDFEKDDWTTILSVIDDGLVFFISIIQLILSTMADRPAPAVARAPKDQCPLEGASLPSRLTFSWLLSSKVVKLFHEFCLSRKPPCLEDEATENLLDERSESQDGNRRNFGYVYPNGKSLFTILLRISKKFLTLASILEVVYTLFYFLPVCILSLLLDNEKERQEWHNYLYASALFITLVFSSFADSQRKYYGLMGALRIKTAVMNAVFQKALKVSEQSENIKQLLTTDSDNVFQMICVMTEVWGAPIRFLAGIYIFWYYLGAACFVGIASAMILIPMNVIVEQGASYFQDRNKLRIRDSFECICSLKTTVIDSRFSSIAFDFRTMMGYHQQNSHVFLRKHRLSNISVDEDTQGNSVLLTNASFSWEGMDIPCLKYLNLRIPKGSLIAVVGETRSGKSSLLRALLGEMHKTDGMACVNGEISYVGEEPWIQNATVEKNILFLKSKDEKLYRKTLEACALLPDIDNLPAGEETEIGQKGIHLSQNQKLKVELARAVYQNADVYLLDNPLRNLDASLAEHLWHRVIGRSGLLKLKTRILTTAREEFLPLVDFILVMKDGRIVEQGTYAQLKEKQGHFVEYQSISTTTKDFHHSEKEGDTELFHNKFGKQSDLWYSTTVSPAKIEPEHLVTDEITVYSKGFFYKITDFLKTIGFSLATVSILIAGLACACEVASGVWLSEWTDRHDGTKSSTDSLLIYTGFICFQIFLTIICGLIIFATSTTASDKLHTWLLTRIVRASQTALEMKPIQKIIHSFDADFHYADEKIPETFYVWLMAIFRVPALLVVVFVVSPFLAVLCIPLIFVFIVIQKLYLLTWQQLQHLTTATSCPLSNLLEDVLHGSSHIRATQSFSHFYERFHLKMDTHNNCCLLFFLVSRWLSCSIDIITSFLVLVTTVMALYDRDKGDGFIGLVIVYSMQIAEALTTLVYMNSMLSNDLIAFERIKSFSQLKQESEWEDPANRPLSAWPDPGQISIQNLTTAYGEGLHPVLHDITLSIEPGEKVAIVGKEESGTSTLLYTLFRLIEPLKGQIIIDNINISNLGLKDLRSSLAIIPQESLVFSGTVRQNLDPKQKYKDDELWRALELANLKSSISNLDCVIGDYLSAEEKHLFSIARCLLKKPKIVIIDELETPNSRQIQFFPESTVLSFCGEPLPDFNGRTIRLMSGEVIEGEFSSA
ncbi:Multidrug resistance-associated protein 1 like [Argiope bruennichi]|uniref:Multidrug resistance-associated protein 1 like n=1 Tax=Argiope bruennichi TaxID=94029 RepID=A0A8T0F0A8_ARGBR|nr:Multidrug resistance-associated protein 1 like [Argiope bruennichi]